MDDRLTQKIHVVLVDDEHDFLKSTGVFLQENGMEVILSSNVEDALNAVREFAPDIAVLDIILGEGDGINLCRQIKKETSIPIIFLSGRGDETERIVGLEVGADDYIAKPCNPRELVARIRAVMRRINVRDSTEQVSFLPTKESLAFGPWVLDASKHQLTHDDGSDVPLSYGELRLLRVFLNFPYRVMSREELLSYTHGENANVFDRSVDNYIARLRKKIEPDSKSPSLLKTYWGGGYALNCSVETKILD